MGLLTQSYRETISQDDYIRFLAAQNRNNEFVCILCQHGSFDILGDGNYCTIFHASSADGVALKTVGICCANCGMVYQNTFNAVTKWLAKTPSEGNNG